MKLQTLKPRLAELGSRIKAPAISAGSWEGSQGTARQRGYDAKWRRERARYLAENPLCVMCLAMEPSHVEAATVVDHKIPHMGDKELFWNRNNWQSLCKPHHDSHAQKRDNAYKAKL